MERIARTDYAVTQIWRYPVKSMGGEQLAQAAVSKNGIELDRGWAVWDEKVGTIRGARYIPRLLMCSARYLPDTKAGFVPHVEITLPDGDTVNSDDPSAARRLSDAVGRAVHLIPLRPEHESDHLRHVEGWMETGDITSEMRMLFGLTPDEPMPDMTAMPADMMSKLLEYVAPPGTFFDAYPIDVVTMSSVRQLQRLLPEADLDLRRFRPNLVLDDGTDSAGVVERDWVGRRLRIGREALLSVTMECPRCTMVAAAQPGIARDSTITRTLVREMRQMMSVYCEVATSGLVSTGDPVAFEQRSATATPR